MNRLYIFAIGGSGERVLKSLALTLAAGTPINANEVIPVIVDNDAESAALKDCERILTAYGTTDGDNGVHTLYEKAFGNDTSQWPSFCSTVIRNPILLNVAGNTIGNLEGIIDCPTESNRKEDREKNELIRSISIERDLLFTKEDLEMPLTVGFIGNPNIGSVVLNSLFFDDSAFTSILSGIQSNDGVMVIGSLFGGTGAAGFPLIVNTFNDITDKTRKPVLGGIAILPYFDTNLSTPAPGAPAVGAKWGVNSETFATKTRAALMYYDDYMMGVDCMYYVGDDKHQVHKYAVGAKAQDNQVNLVELLSAMSIIDFAKQNHNDSTIYKQPIWGFSDEGRSSNVSGITNEEIRNAFVKFQMLELMMKNEEFMKKAIGKGPNDLNSEFVNKIHFTEEIRTSIITNDIPKHVPATGLNQLFKEWDKWVADLSNSKAVRKMNLFNHSVKTDGENITKNFCAEGEFGIAKTITKHVGGVLGMGGHDVTEALPPEILDAMFDVFRSLPDSMKRNVSEYQIIPYELLIISKALDKVINEKCSL